MAGDISPALNAFDVYSWKTTLATLRPLKYLRIEGPTCICRTARYAPVLAEAITSVTAILVLYSIRHSGVTVLLVQGL